MDLKLFTVGQVAKQANCKVETVHYYEKIGLIPNPARTEGGHRQYNLDGVKRLNFIRQSRELGFSIEQIRLLLKFVDEPNHLCGEVNSMVIEQTKIIDEKINALKKLNLALKQMSNQCDDTNNSIDQCPIVDALYNKYK